MKNEEWKICARLSKSKQSLVVYLCGSSKDSRLRLCLSVRLLSNVDERFDLVRKIYNDCRGRPNHAMGWSHFVGLARLQDPKYGYIRNGKVRFDIDVTAV